MIQAIIFIALLSAFIHFYTSMKYGKKQVDVNTVSLLREIVAKDELGIFIDVKDESPYYDSSKKVIVMPDKKTIFGMVSGFHELGHVYDDLEKDYEGSYSVLFYYVMKYSILLAILGYYAFLLMQTLYLGLLAVVFSLISFYFFVVVIREEFGATKHAKRLMKEYLSLDKTTENHAYYCMYGALSTYISLYIMALGVLIVNLSKLIIFFL